MEAGLVIAELLARGQVKRALIADLANLRGLMDYALAHVVY